MSSLTKKQIDELLLWPSSYERFTTFLEISDDCKGSNYWYALRKAYIISDNLFAYRDQVKQAFKRDEPNKEQLMTKEERDYLAALPNEITIYRGMTIEEFESKDYNISWTLSEKVADYFINTYRRNHDTRNFKKTICTLRIDKSNIIAYFNTRNEHEIIYQINCKV